MKRGDKIEVYDGEGSKIQAIYWSKEKFNQHHVKIPRVKGKGFISWYVNESRLVGFKDGSKGPKNAPRKEPDPASNARIEV